MLLNQHEDEAFGSVTDQDVNVDFECRKTIFLNNLETMRRLIEAFGKLKKVGDFDGQNAER